MIINKDCLEALKILPDNSIDSIVTDPPYGLSFMGKKWDYDVPSVEIWSECLRVLKPGGYLLAFAGTRTQHRMAVRIEDAGFEIRDMIAWIYGSGFPKSRNIGLDVDKRNGVTKNRGKAFVVAGQSGQRDKDTGGDLVPGSNTMGAYIAQNEWSGWGTALKPALEPITVARKPIEGTVAENCLKWGVGGINIDGCRVGIDKDDDIHAKNPHTVHIKSNLEFTSSNGEAYKVPTGRFPANLIHDGSDEVVELFPNTKSGAVKRFTNNGANQPINLGGGMLKPTEGSQGSAARFFKTCSPTLKHDKISVCKHINVNNVAYFLTTILPTEDNIVLSNVEGSQDRQLVLNVKSVVKGCDLCETLIAQELVRIKNLVSKTGGLQAIQDFIGNYKNSIPHQNLAEIVTEWVNTDIIPTTTSLLKLCGSVLLATDENTNLESKEVVAVNGEPKRFLYQAKASKSERNMGLDGFEEKQKAGAEFRPNHQEKAQQGEDGNPFGRWNKIANNHPTVKPIKLMEYLVNLVSKPGHTVLDPFAGSGTTGIACKKLNRNFIGIERDEEYCKIAEARINNLTSK